MESILNNPKSGNRTDASNAAVDKIVEAKHGISSRPIEQIDNQNQLNDYGRLYDYDVVFLTAVYDEFVQLKKVLSVENRGKFCKGLFIHECSIGLPDIGRMLKGAIVNVDEMGLTHTAVRATQAIILLQPKILVMTGVCAALSGKAKCGDVVFFRDAYQHDSGKLKNGALHPDISTLGVSAHVDMVFSVLGDYKSQKTIAEDIEKAWTDPYSTQNNIKLIRATVGSGSFVVADSKMTQSISQKNRRMSAIDMETYAIAYAAKYAGIDMDWIVFKGVQDDGTSGKDSYEKDRYRHFAAYASAYYALEFVKLYFLIGDFN